MGADDAGGERGGPDERGGRVTLAQRIQRVTAWVQRRKPVRVFTRYTDQRGPLLSQGLSWQAVFAVFAALWVAFAIAGFLIGANPALRTALFDYLALNIPGLIDRGEGGAVDPEDLLSAGILGWTGAIAAVGLLFTALGWFAAGRDAIRAMLRLPGAPTNILLLKLKDLGMAIGFGVVIAGSAVLTVLSTSAVGALLDWLGIDDSSFTALLAVRAGGLAVTAIVDLIVLAAFYRVVAGVAIPLQILLAGAALAAVALGVLKALGTLLLAGASANPLLAGFAVIIGLLIWFNLICQVILIGAAWIGVTADDHGIDLARAKRDRAKQRAADARRRAEDAGSGSGSSAGAGTRAAL